MSLIYFIQEHLHLRVHHGGTGNADADRIWLQAGHLPVEFPGRENFSIGTKIRRLVYLLKQLRKIRNEDILVFQFPLYAGMNKLLVQLLIRKKVRMICFITDIDGLKDGDPLKLKREIRFFKQFRFFIVHNPVMKNWLLQFVPDAEAVCINFFDFLAIPCEKPRIPDAQIVFAGNLSKSLFLEKIDLLNSKVLWNVYGPGITPRMLAQTSIVYKGIVEPHEMPSLAEGAFGLVWDGDSVQGAGGVFGEYMQYITHHKVSLYVLAGLPVICYSKAGSAGLIEKYGLGLLIDDLNGLAALLARVSDEQYQQMRENMRRLADRISTGKCLGEAMEEICSKIRQPGAR